MSGEVPSVAIFHNVVSPYRNPLFEALNEIYDVTVYFCKASDDAREWTVSLEPYGFDYKILEGVSVGPFILNHKLPVQLLTESYDVYLASEALESVLSTYMAAATAKNRNQPFVLWSGVMETEHAYQRLPAAIHDLSVGEPAKRVLLRLYAKVGAQYRRLLYRATDSFVAYSNPAKEYLIEKGASAEDVFVGGQVMPANQIARSNRSASDSDGLTVLYLGYLREVKGVDVLINAFGRIAAESDVELVIAGTGDAEGQLRELAGDSDRIRFVGYVDGTDKSDLYNRSDIFVLPTFHDPWGLVVNEAMEFGLPVITTKAAASSHHLIQDNGIVVPVGDAQALAGAISRLLRDDGLREHMGTRSKEIISEYNSVEEGIRPFVQAIDRVLDG